jgi:hypothetical protein
VLERRQLCPAGLLGIALHPRFPHNPGVYLLDGVAGADSIDLANVHHARQPDGPFVWDGHTLGSIAT